MTDEKDEIINKFQDISENALDYAKSAKKQTGRKMLGFFCSYTPEELLQAAGAIPLRLFGTAMDIEHAESHLQSYCCSLARGGLEDALKGRLDFLDGTVFPHTCDAIQRLSDIWRLNAGFDIHIDVVMPVKLNTPSAGKYMIDVLARCKTELERSLDITITETDIAESIRLYNRIRSSLSALYEIRNIRPDSIASTAMYHTMKASMVMDREELAEDLEKLLASMDKTEIEAKATGRKRIMLSGGICNHPNIYTIIDDAGGDIVWDDLCTGMRYATGLISEAGDPLEAIATRYINRINCPTKHFSMTSRGDQLTSDVCEKKIDGVIFLLLKFCDPHAFDYPYLKEFLDKANVASMLLEIEEQTPPKEQLKTRFETFIDML